MKFLILAAIIALAASSEINGTEIKTCVDALTAPANTCATTSACYSTDVEPLYTNEAITDEEFHEAEECLETL